MPTCPRCAALALLLLALAGCDSNNPGRDLDLIEGVYTLESITFVSSTPRLDPIKVSDRLDLPNSTLEIFGDDETSILRIRYLPGSSGSVRNSNRVDLNTTASRGRATFEVAGADRSSDTEALEAILLPPSFTLTYEGDTPRTLSGTFDQVVNLEAYDPEGYRNIRDNPGTLTVRFRRP